MAEATVHDEEGTVLTNDVVNRNCECPSFKSYEKMAESSNGLKGDFKSIKKWVVLEKIHGSNFSITTWQKSDQEDDIGVKLGRRTAYLKADERFYKLEEQLEFQAYLKKCAVKAWKNVRATDKDIEAMTIFGELFGGFYPHSSVDKVPNVPPIQKEVVYCPDVKFCAFDIAVFRTGKEREYMDYDIAMSVFSDAGFMYSQPLSICSFEEALGYKLGFVTPLPEKFGLPPIDDNLAEGVVIKPLKNVVLENYKGGSQRVIIKRKINKFSERKPKGPPKNGKKNAAAELKQPVPTSVQELELLKYEMYPLVTEQRLVNTISKIGLPYEAEDEHKWLEIQTAMEADVKTTLQEENEELWKSSSPVVKELLSKEISESCASILTEYRKTINGQSS